MGAQVLGDAAGTHVFDVGGVVGEHVIRGELQTFAHIPAETHVLRLDPLVGDALEGARVLRRLRADLARRGSSSAGFVRDGGREGGFKRALF